MDTQLMEQGDGMSLRDFINIAIRRRYVFFIPAMVVLLITILIALGLPASYLSTATILIEEQEIPEDFVRSTVSTYADQQIQTITQRVMTLENIEQVVNKFNLYDQASAESKLPRTELAEVFGENVNLELVSADVVDPRSGKPTQATIAFTLSFEDKNPSTAQKVANEMVTLYLNENLRDRAIKASGATDFLSAEADSINKELVEKENKLAAFKEENEGALPELYQYNLSVVERTDRELSDVNLRLQGLQKTIIELSSQRALLSPTAPVVLPTGETVLSPTDRLKALQSEFRDKSAVYNPEHPEIKRIKREIAVLEASAGGSDYTDIYKDLERNQEKLESLRAQYKEGHPEIVAAENSVKLLEDSLKKINSDSKPDNLIADNPSYVLLDTQIKSAQSEINSLKEKKIILSEKMEHYEDLIRRAPQVEKEYQHLMRDHQAAELKYQDIKAKYREAEVAKNLEQDRKGERFTLIQPPEMPLTPSSPNRIAIIFFGIVFSGLVGVASAAIKEALDTGIYGEKQLEKIMTIPPLVVIPYLENSVDLEERKKRHRNWIISIFSVVIVLVAFIHLFYKPVDVLWFVILQKLGLGV